MGLSPIDAAVFLLHHAWDARALPWAGLPGSFLFSRGSFLASDRRYSSIEVLMKPTVLFFWQIGFDIRVHFV